MWRILNDPQFTSRRVKKKRQLKAETGRNRIELAAGTKKKRPTTTTRKRWHWPVWSCGSRPASRGSTGSCWRRCWHGTLLRRTRSCRRARSDPERRQWAGISDYLRPVQRRGIEIFRDGSGSGAWLGLADSRRRWRARLPGRAASVEPSWARPRGLRSGASPVPGRAALDWPNAPPSSPASVQEKEPSIVFTVSLMIRLDKSKINQRTCHLKWEKRIKHWNSYYVRRTVTCVTFIRRNTKRIHLLVLNAALISREKNPR